MILLALTLSVSLSLSPCLLPPVDAPVADPFRPPPCTWCPGNRGIEFATRPGQPVIAARGGTVTFAGVVAGTRYLVVRHADGLRATYGRLASAAVGAGDVVVTGQRIGVTGRGFYFGLRDGERPVDPTPLLGHLRYPTRLVPSDGSPAPPAGPGRLVCPAAGRTPAG